MSEDRFVEVPGGRRICYRVDGPDDGPPLLLIAGLGLDLTSWPRRMLDGFTGHGLRVIRLDNRDAGRSTRVQARPPSMLRQLFARPVPGAYDLGDMAGDVDALLEDLGTGPVHVLGMSMGGMIAQTLAARHPGRVATLTSVFSTTGDRKVGQPAPSTMLRMAKRPARTVEQAVERHLSLLRHIGSAEFPPDDAEERAWVAGMWDRGSGRPNAAGVGRQIGAIQASGDRTAQLRAITAPTLVIHGDADFMVHPSGGRATAAAIPGARHVEIPGMRHHFAPGVVDRVVALTTDHITTTAGAPSQPAGAAAGLADRPAGGAAVAGVPARTADAGVAGGAVPDRTAGAGVAGGAAAAVAATVQDRAARSTST
ncbi:alpha/beta fold hydrolase [Dactylosporangium sp. NPDC005555]|uniref:alpha/beta fold hydrolase n=1 Tax=Dactylosporangium sp. NPDC005555 TaxID=3154889 RepID=UPI0033B9240E